MAGKIYDFSGKILDPTTNKEGDSIAKMLGTALAHSNEKKADDIMKFYLWTKDLLSGSEELVLDSEDIKKLKSFIETSQFMGTWVKGTIFELLDTPGKEIPKTDSKPTK